jgi:hypothetical protein
MELPSNLHKVWPEQKIGFYREMGKERDPQMHVIRPLIS